MICQHTAGSKVIFFFGRLVFISGIYRSFCAAIVKSFDDRVARNGCAHLDLHGAIILAVLP